MKKLSLLFKAGLFLTMLILLAAALPAQAKVVKTEFTGFAYFHHVIDEGELSNPDGNIHVRGWTELYFDDMSDPRMSGFETVVANLNFQSAPPPVFGTGPMWGTSRIENEGGYWDTTWTGVRDEQGFSYIRVVAHGHGGYEGLKAIYEGSRLSPDPTYPWTFTGTILDPHGE